MMIKPNYVGYHSIDEQLHYDCLSQKYIQFESTKKCMDELSQKFDKLSFGISPTLESTINPPFSIQVELENVIAIFCRRGPKRKNQIKSLRPKNKNTIKVNQKNQCLGDFFIFSFNFLLTNTLFIILQINQVFEILHTEDHVMISTQERICLSQPQLMRTLISIPSHLQFYYPYQFGMQGTHLMMQDTPLIATSNNTNNGIYA